MKPELCATGVPGLDAMLGGGLLRGDANLVAGSPGTGKTTLALHFLAEGARLGEPTVFVSFEYLPQQLYRDAKQRGWDLRALEDRGLARVICTTPEVLLGETSGGSTLLQDCIRDIGAKRLVIDSLTHLEFLDKNAHQLRAETAGLMTRLRMMDVTALLTHEVPEIIGSGVRISQYGVEFLVDTIILLRYLELEGELQKAVGVLKHRGSDHDRRYHRMNLVERGMEVEGAFQGVENISGGAARRSVVQRARELV
jgi:circadian clock protein KaiC